MHQPEIGEHKPYVVIGGRTEKSEIPKPLMAYLEKTFTLEKEKMQSVFGEQNVVLLVKGLYGN